QEIDRERLAAARLQKELDAAALRAEQRDAQQRREVAALQAHLGDALHRCGVLQGQLDGAQAADAARGKELDALRREMTALSRRSALRGAKAAPAAQRDERRARTRKRADEAPPR
ncbi:ATPase, partial [Alcaligenes phenolicus]